MPPGPPQADGVASIARRATRLTRRGKTVTAQLGLRIDASMAGRKLDVERLRTIRRISEFGTVAFVHQREQLGLGVLVVTHDLDMLLNIVERVIVLSQGRVIADGPVSAVREADDPWLREYFAARA